MADAAATAEGNRRFVDSVGYQERNIQRDVRQLHNSREQAFLAMQKAHVELLRCAENVVSRPPTVPHGPPRPLHHRLP